MKTISVKEADAEIIELVKASKEARKNSYSPYSNFPVGAAVRTVDHSIYTGCNIENSVYPAAICAERTAIVKAASEGHRKFQSVAVCAEFPGENKFVTPCGLCRQFMAEFGTDIQVYMVTPDLNEILICSVEELLPLSFHL